MSGLRSSNETAAKRGYWNENMVKIALAWKD